MHLKSFSTCSYQVSSLFFFFLILKEKYIFRENSKLSYENYYIKILKELSPSCFLFKFTSLKHLNFSLRGAYVGIGLASKQTEISWNWSFSYMESQ
jgi:hypothetical protein